MRRITSHRDQAELTLPWRSGFAPDPALDTPKIQPGTSVDLSAESPAVEGFREFLDSAMSPQNPEEALREYLMVWRPDERINYETLQRYIGQSPDAAFPYHMEPGEKMVSGPKEPWAVVTYPPGYENDYDDPAPGPYYSRRRRR